MLFAVGAAAAPGLAADFSAPWVELAANGELSVRSAVAPDANCPQVAADGIAVPAVRRAMPDDGFPVLVCESRVPATVRGIIAGNASLPVLKPRIDRIAVIGDTGCRVAGKAAQDCRDPAGWPFAAIAKAAAARHPDLVIHVGDYYYRENACPAGKAGCAGTPYGDRWPTWQAELFAPAAPLLAAAPWVMVRGNHEVCRRGGHGWFRLLDPSAPRTECPDRTDPYRLSIGGLNLLLFDDADADDFLAPPDKVAAYREQLVPLLADAPPQSWLVAHRPVWAMAQAQLHGLSGNQTMQQAIKEHVPARLDLVLSGHLHDFISYEFGPERPAQLVVGTGGDTLLSLTKDPIAGAEIDGMTVRRGFAAERFGYLILDRAGDGWDGALYAPDDAVIARCRLSGREIDCR